MDVPAWLTGCMLAFLLPSGAKTSKGGKFTLLLLKTNAALFICLFVFLETNLSFGKNLGVSS